MRSIAIYVTRAIIGLILGGTLSIGDGAAVAQVPLPQEGGLYGVNSATLSQDVIVSVEEINELAMSDAAVTLTIDSAVPGQNPDPTQEATTTYGITTNGSGKKITVALSAPFAEDLGLTLALAAPTGATSTPRVLTTTAQTLVTGLEKIAASELAVTYTATASLSATPNAGGGGETRTVTLTLTDS